MAGAAQVHGVAWAGERSGPADGPDGRAHREPVVGVDAVLRVDVIGCAGKGCMAQGQADHEGQDPHDCRSGCHVPFHQERRPPRGTSARVHPPCCLVDRSLTVSQPRSARLDWFVRRSTCPTSRREIRVLSAGVNDVCTAIPRTPVRRHDRAGGSHPVETVRSPWTPRKEKETRAP